MKKHFNPRSGISLMELLIALALLAFIAAGLAGAMGLSIRLYDRSANLSKQVDELSRRTHLRNWLAGAVPETLLVPFTNSFEGKTDQLTFTTLKPSYFAPDAAAMRVKVYVEDNVLLLEAMAIEDDNSVLATFGGVLAQNATDIRFNYYDGSDEGGWKNEWADPALPALVRIQVASGSIPEWPEFTVKLRFANLEN